jgi:hypothetical protein
MPLAIFYKHGPVVATAPKWAASSAILLALACSAGEKGPGSERAPAAAPIFEGGPNGDSSGVGPAGSPDFGDLNGGTGLGGTRPGSGCATTLSGIARDPAGRLPLYNVVVYVPSEPLAAIQKGASCETCSGDFSGRPIAAAVSDASGAFTLDITSVPTRENIPLVIQAGKWRREVTVPSANDCANTALAPDLSRLPRNRAEGNLPHVAVMRGGSDALECLFTKIGVDVAEFTPGARGGAVELFYSDLANATEETGRMREGAETLELPRVEELFSDFEALRTYDMVLLSCEGGDDRYDPPDLTHRENLQRYANLGGRLFGGHYHNGIIDNRELPDDYPEFPAVVEFADGRNDIEPTLFTANVNVSFDKGKALADWLLEVGGSTEYGEISINDSERTVTGMLDESAVSFIDTRSDDEDAALYYGFPTPVAGPACGRMVFTDVHLAAGSGDSGKEVFPSCSDDLTPQQKALAFLIFDLANCVQTTETATPIPPTIY